MTIRSFPRFAPPGGRGRHRAGRSRGVVLALTMALALGAVVGVGATLVDHAPQASAAPPFDNNSTARTDAIEQTGLTLTDPSQPTGSKTHWVGSYNTFGATPGFCVDYYYDYPYRQYGYTTTTASAITARAYASNGVSGVNAARIAYLVNTHLTNTTAGEMAATSMAIDLLMAGGSFTTSYNSYFKAQVGAAVTARVTALLAASNSYRGPYTLSIAYAAGSKVGTASTVTFTAVSAAGVRVPNLTLNIAAVDGASVPGGQTSVTNAHGQVVRRYTPTSTRTDFRVTAAAPSNLFRLGYAPTHMTSNLITGSQRLVLAAAAPSLTASAVKANISTVPVAPAPTGQTQVVGGTGSRPVGAPVSDLFTGANYTPNATYTATITLQTGDDTPQICGTVTMTVKADATGKLTFTSTPIPSCGGGTNTFVESIKDSTGKVIVTTPPNQPRETFPIGPQGSTQVVGGNSGRPVGTPVADTFTGEGFVPDAVYSYTVTLQTEDDSPVVCGTATGTATASATGTLTFTTPTVNSCGSGTNTFFEVVKDSTGKVIATTSPGVPSESFPITPASGATQVVGGNGPRAIGAPVADGYVGKDFTPGAVYSYTVTLQDTSGKVCGTTTGSATADAQGNLTFTTGTVLTCGSGANTFWESIKDKAGTVVATTPPGAPKESFPVVKPNGSTTVVGGTGPRVVGTPVADKYVGSGFVPGAVYSYTVTLQDTTGVVCGTATGKATADAAGTLTFITPTVPTCGGGYDTFWESVQDRAGKVVAVTAPWAPNESYPVKPQAKTAVMDGNHARSNGARVQDKLTGNGFMPGATYTGEATLHDINNTVCGTSKMTAKADAKGNLVMVFPAIAVCGSDKNTFFETVKDSRKITVATTPSWVPIETFPLSKPAAVAGGLAFTGANVLPLAGIAVLLIGGGALALIAGRRRKSTD